jgi:hypothetical protein
LVSPTLLLGRNVGYATNDFDQLIRPVIELSLNIHHAETAQNPTRRATVIGSGPPCWLSLCYMEQRDIRRARHTLQPLYDGAGEMSSD